ncbi:MAG TPA: glycoside hydrolase family 3 N-terminal domain-containing protein [Solirubrobacterales bacterium]
MRGTVRRGIAIGAAVIATAAVYLLLVRDEGPEADHQRAAGGEDVPAGVRALVAGLTPEQKVDGIMLVGFEGTDSASPVMETLSGRQLGGVVVRASNWLDATQGAALVDELRSAAAAGGEVPPLVATPQEGGEYRALADLPPESRELDVGDLGDPELALEWGRETGEALRDAGFDMNLAPIADVATLDSPIADRAFSDDANVTAQLTAAAVRGCAEAEIACVARHFPGLGAASSSTDEGPATVSLDAATLASRDLAPFQAAIAEGVPAVMLSHAFYAAYDPVTPGSLSPEVATGLLRDQLGFTGVAITDDLGTGAVRATTGTRPAAIVAVNAGADMLLVESPDEAEGVREALLGAVGSGEIPAERIDQAVGRVLELKRALGLIGEEPDPDPDPEPE